MSITHGIKFTEEIKAKYSEILMSNGITGEIKDIQTEAAELKGEHLGSDCEYVTITFVDNELAPVEWFIKKKVYNPLVQAMFDAMMVFEKESCFFNFFLPDTKRFCDSRLGKNSLMNCFALSYYADNTTIVLDNLAKRDFVMLEKSELQNFEQAKVVLTNMAKFHGVSAAMIADMGEKVFAEKYPVPAKETYICKEMEQMLAPMIQNNLRTCIKILEKHPQEGTAEAAKWLAENIPTAFDGLCEAVQNGPNDVIRTLTHGDCWNNNMMFVKDPETNEIVDHKFVDMQIIRYGSPNLDTSFFLFTSVIPEVRREKLDSLLKVYFDTYKETILSLSGTCDITFQDFMKDYKKKCTFGFTCGLSFMTAIGAMKDMDENTGITDLEELTKYFTQVISNWIEKNPEKSSKISRDAANSVHEYIKITGS